MPEKVSINATLTKQNGKTTQKAITDINPNASASAITDFVTELFGLTTNIYAGADRISKIPVSEFVAPKKTPTLTLGEPRWSSQGSRHATMSYTYDGDGIICASAYRNDTDAATSTDVEPSTHTTAIFNDDGWKTATFHICTTETDNYKSVSQTITITDPNQ